MLLSAKAKAKAKGVIVDLKKVSNTELTSRLEKLVRSERKLTHIILVHILEVESRRLYAELGFDGMFSYLTKGFGYSESAAYRRLQTARLLKQVPMVADKLEQGSLNLSQLTQVQKCLKTEKLNVTSATTARNNSVEIILAKIENKNGFETKKILAVEFDQPAQIQTILTPQKDESVRLELTFTKKQFELLEAAKSLISHSIHNNSLSEVIEYLAQHYLKTKNGSAKYKNKKECENKSESIIRLEIGKEIGEENKDKDKDKDRIKEDKEGNNNEKVRNGKEVKDHEENREGNGALEFFRKDQRNHLQKMTRGFAATKAKRPYLSIKLRRSILHDAKQSCQFVDISTGRRCDSKYQLQVDHIHPFSKGGSDEKENLQILCRTHNYFKGACAGR